MTPKGWFIFLGVAWLALTETCWGQPAANWRVFKRADGLPESAGVSVTVSQQGKVLLKHPNLGSVSELDGYTVNVIPAPEETIPNRVYGSPAGQLWSVTAGGLREFRDGDWMVHSVPEIADTFRAGISSSVRAVPLCPVRQGIVLFLLPDRLMEFNAEQPDRPQTRVLLLAAQTRLESFSGMTLAGDGGLWIAGKRGVVRGAGPVRNLKPDSEWREWLPPESLGVHNLQEPWETPDGGLTLVAESAETTRKRVVQFDGQRWTAFSVGNERLRFAWSGPDKSLWAATINSLFQRETGETELTETSEVAARSYFDLAVEPGGAFWLATSDGLFRYALPVWRCPAPIQKINSLVHSLVEDAAGRLWFIAGTSLHVLEDELHREHPLPATATGNAATAHALFPLKDGSLLVDAGDQLLQFQPATGAFNVLVPASSPRPFRPLGLLTDGSLCVFQPGDDPANEAARLETFDGHGFQSFVQPLPEALSAAPPNSLFMARNGDLWLSSEAGIAWYQEKKWRTFPVAEPSVPEDAQGFLDMPDGRVWCATMDRVWEFDGKDWLPVRSGFDHINRLLRGRDGSIWVASNSGLHRFHQGAWIENGLEEGLPSENVREVYEDRRGRLWAGTTHGPSLYHADADPDPPQTQIQPRTELENTVPEGGTITIAFTGQDKWKHTPRNRLLYSYRLDERDWTLFQDVNTISFTDLPPGKHYFQVRAMDRNGNVDPRPAKLEFAVALPWFKEPRLLYISVAGLAVALFFAGLAFNRHRQLLRSYAEVEKKVAERTQELERAGRELLHSQKMNALGTLAAGLAHDFNNILSIVKGSAQIIEDNLDKPDKIHTRVDRIKMVADQGAGVVKALLGFSRDSARSPAACDLNAVVDDTLKLLGDRFLREVEIRFERAPDLPEVTAIRDCVQQILLNFIFNAAESMTDRKRVVLATRRLAALPAGTVLAPAATKEYVAVSVQDFGCGIPPEKLPRIFEPFFTTKALSTRRGTGLGLSMAYELAKKMEAGLAVESVVSKGSLVTLILPVRELPAVTESETHVHHAP
ncbi:MAG: hypothetical protein IH623_02930 [Verrucomicrobia bacterium]|nr:hypothetical protein [Verrucomicrobiota bacterium]